MYHLFSFLSNLGAMESCVVAVDTTWLLVGANAEAEAAARRRVAIWMREFIVWSISY